MNDILPRRGLFSRFTGISQPGTASDRQLQPWTMADASLRAARAPQPVLEAAGGQRGVAGA
eukprot:242438-Alexandrium_andersonii.AAC.1